MHKVSHWVLSIILHNMWLSSCGNWASNSVSHLPKFKAQSRQMLRIRCSWAQCTCSLFISKCHWATLLSSQEIQDLPQRGERTKGKVCVLYSYVPGLHRVKFQVILPVGKEGKQRQFVKSCKAYQEKQMSFSLHTLSTQSVGMSA